MKKKKDPQAVVNADEVVSRLCRWVGVQLDDPKWRRRRDPVGMARRAVLVCLALREGLGVNQLARTIGIHKETVILIGRQFEPGDRQESTLASMLSQDEAATLTDVEVVNWDAKLREPPPVRAARPRAKKKAKAKPSRSGRSRTRAVKGAKAAPGRRRR